MKKHSIFNNAITYSNAVTGATVIVAVKDFRWELLGNALPRQKLEN